MSLFGFGRRKKVVAAVGEIAPPFRLKSLDGSEKSLEEILQAGPALLTFFKISCPVCKMTLPYLQRLTAGGKLQVIGISQDDADVTRSFLQRIEVEFPTLVDQAAEEYPASNQYGISSVPTLFLIQPGGAIERAFNGFSKRDLEEISAGAGVPIFNADEHVPEWKAG